MFNAVRGSTLHIPGTGPHHDRERGHLFVILTDPCPAGKVLAVPVCTVRTRFDPTCVIDAGSHPALPDKSYVAYFYLQQFAAKVLESQVEKKIIRDDKPIAPNLLASICEGVAKSRQGPPIYQRYFAEREAAMKLKK